MKVIRSFSIILTLGIFLSSCVKEEATPELPPPQSMVMEFDNFWKNPPSQATNPSSSPQSNFGFAATTIIWWNSVLTVQLVIPVAAYLESFNHEAEWDNSSSSWVWAYTVDLPNASYTAELIAKSMNDEINWSMYLSKAGGFTDFLWFTGKSAMDNKSGMWTISKDPESNIKDDDGGVPYLDILWSMTEDETYEISYTNIEEGSVNNGSFIKYGLIDDPVLNAYYDIFNIWENNLINIKWNTSEHFGRVLSMSDFQDPYWHCWTEAFQNIACE